VEPQASRAAVDSGPWLNRWWMNIPGKATKH